MVMCKEQMNKSSKMHKAKLGVKSLEKSLQSMMKIVQSGMDSSSLGTIWTRLCVLDTKPLICEHNRCTTSTVMLFCIDFSSYSDVTPSVDADMDSLLPAQDDLQNLHAHFAIHIAQSSDTSSFFVFTLCRMLYLPISSTSTPPTWQTNPMWLVYTCPCHFQSGTLICELLVTF